MRSRISPIFAVAVGFAFGIGFAACGGDDGPGDGGCVARAEVCNQTDDDCDGQVDEGITIAIPCDGPDNDTCNEGTTTCAPDGGVVCSDVTGNSVERCNGIDDDCDGATDEDFAIQQPCDGTDSDSCNDGLTICHANQLSVFCSDTGENNLERCNGQDDNCDGVPDDGFDVGQPCDGPDGDACMEGVLQCDSAGTGTICTDQTGNSVEICDGLDNNCDGNPDEGFSIGTPCDGVDSDVCLEGQIVCNTTTTTRCNDTTPSTVETCNGEDDDCDGAVDEGFNVGAPCDGPDTDACAVGPDGVPEGLVECSGPSTTRCTDTSSNNIEVCNDLDDDCDGVVDEVPVCCNAVNGNLCDSDKGETCANCPTDCHAPVDCP